MPGWDRLVCVDWGKDLSKRRAWIADVELRRISPVRSVEPTLASLIAFARALPGRTVIAIDAALGVPRHYLDGARAAVPAWSDAADFLTWVVRATRKPSVLREVRAPSDWRYDRPFISVPAGEGALRGFWAHCGGKLLRQIDVTTGAKSPFVVSGIPGTVGSGSRALWVELADVLGSSDLAVWPFDGTLQMIDRRIALAEIYPRVCYSLALATELPAPLMRLGKTSRDVRDRAVVALAASLWVRHQGVTLADLDLARTDEDDFDAMISAAGLLRCVLEGRPLDEPVCDPIEGGILGTPCVRFDAPGSRPPRAPRRTDVVPPASSPRAEASVLRCPIPGCAKLYRGGRGGWDSHVASRAKHPDWFPDVHDEERRKAIFRDTYPDWLTTRRSDG